MARRSIAGNVVIVLTMVVFGLGAAFGAAVIWRGVAEVVGAPRIDGSLSNVACVPVVRSGWSCDGTFRADGSSQPEQVAVEGVRGGGDHSGALRARLIRRVETFGYVTLQPRDTAYVGGAVPSAVGFIVIAVVLTLLALLVLGSVALLGYLRLMTWWRGRGAGARSEGFR